MSQILANAADVAIGNALQDLSVVTGTDEPDEVARLVSALPDNLVNEWSGYVATGAMTVSAAFCHAKPRVAWASPLVGRTTPHKPELGDLLLIMDVQGPTGRKRRALLIQVKKSKSRTLKCTLTVEGDLVQRYMYSEWPIFNVLGAQPTTTNPPPQNVNIALPNTAKNLQSRYAVVRSAGTSSPGWKLELATAPFLLPTPPIATSFKSIGNVTIGAQQTLGTGLAELYSGSTGRDCDVGDDWSNLIAYLENYVGIHTSSFALPHVQPAAAAAPSGLMSATSFLSSPSRFVGYSGNQHLLLGSDKRQWMDPRLLRYGAPRGSFYRWPNHNYPTVPGEKIYEPNGGFGVIKVVLDYPLELESGHTLP